jgi:hypothetical protein
MLLARQQASKQAVHTDAPAPATQLLRTQHTAAGNISEHSLIPTHPPWCQVLAPLIPRQVLIYLCTVLLLLLLLIWLLLLLLLIHCAITSVAAPAAARAASFARRTIAVAGSSSCCCTYSRSLFTAADCTAAAAW